VGGKGNQIPHRKKLNELTNPGHKKKMKKNLQDRMKRGQLNYHVGGGKRVWLTYESPSSRLFLDTGKKATEARTSLHLLEEGPVKLGGRAILPGSMRPGKRSERKGSDTPTPLKIGGTSKRER